MKFDLLATLRAAAARKWPDEDNQRASLFGQAADEIERLGTSAQAQALQRIEAKLDALIAALAEDEDQAEAPQLTLDGQPAGAERDATQPL